MAFKPKPKKNEDGSDIKSEPKEDKPQNVQDMLGQLLKKFGEGAVVRMGDSPTTKVEVIPSGSLALDKALTVGGFPKGRIVEMYGPEMSGKSSLCLAVAAQCQKLGGTVAYIDAEHALDMEYATNCGVDVDGLLFSQPEYGEKALNICEELIVSDLVDMIIVDSVAALVPKAELEADMEESSIGLQARMLSKAMRKLTGITKKHNVLLVFINQLREKVGVIYGSPETTPGGKALKYYCSVRIDIRKIEEIKKGTEHIGNRVRAKVIKNKVGKPGRSGEFVIIFGKGIDAERDIVDMAIELEIIKKAGSWYKYPNDENIGQGLDAACEYLEKNPQLMCQIEQLVKEKLKAQ